MYQFAFAIMSTIYFFGMYPGWVEKQDDAAIFIFVLNMLLAWVGYFYSLWQTFRKDPAAEKKPIYLIRKVPRGTADRAVDFALDVVFVDPKIALKTTTPPLLFSSLDSAIDEYYYLVRKDLNPPPVGILD